MEAQRDEVFDLPTTYNPLEVEGPIYQRWMKGGYFRAEVNPSKEPFCIVIPPPNVTGSLHMGHALDNTLQDVLIRWQRMRGFEALWVPGTDHAGIATQHVVEKSLAAQGKSKEEIGREEFVKLVWRWKEKFGNTIGEQLRKLGASCDWSRERFTMDEGCSRAVRHVFVSLYEKGLIYRGDYMINWCPECRTALSELEVEHEDAEGALYYIRYPFVDGSGSLVVATTRPETMLGDTAVAVHPSDGRYANSVGKRLLLPVANREIPIVLDEFVDPSFGTGVVKVTPAHDPNDFEMGKRHGLESVVVIGLDGRMTAEAGKYAGKDRYQCRKELVEELGKLGYLEQVRPHVHSVGHCYRCDSVVEPLVSRQWFVRVEPLAKPAIEAVENGRVKFVPERFTQVYLNWMRNVRDWCISRQIWWGHRIPAWYCAACGHVNVALTDPERCKRCGESQGLHQDPDVLDTWFSSALWPFSTLGWPDETPELAYFYPTSVLVTGYDIIFFWVARMIMMGLEFAGDVPFAKVLIHGLVRDADGRKMSKSRGTGIDPLEVIDRYGADTLRFSLVTGNAPGGDMRFSDEKVEASRNFCNKIWNASRFVLMNLGDFDPASVALDALREGFGLAERWVLSRYSAIAEGVSSYLDRFEIGEAARSLYDFIWSEFCDWYIELAKPVLYRSDNAEEKLAVRYTLWYVLEGTLRLMHPFMPFITEKIWLALPHEGESLSVSSWPKPDPRLRDEEAEDQMKTIMEVVRSMRNLRAEVKLAPSRKVEFRILVELERDLRMLEGWRSYLAVLGGASHVSVDLASRFAEKPTGCLASVLPGIEVYMPIEGVIDVAREIERVREEIEDTRREFERTLSRLRNEEFLQKAPQRVIAKEEQRRYEYERRLAGLAERLERLRGLS